MINRHVFLAFAACVALPAASLSLGACGSTTVQTPPVTVNTAQPQPQPQPQAMAVPMAQPVMVGPTWVPGGVYDEIGNNMALRARQFAAGYGVASDLIRASIRQGLEGTMVPGTVQAGYCYRIIAVGGTGVRDLDLFLYGANGQEMDHDRATDNFPVLGLNRPLCIPPGLPPQSAQMRIRAYTGSGSIGVQMFAVPFNGQAVPMAQPMVQGPMMGQPGVVYR